MGENAHFVTAPFFICVYASFEILVIELLALFDILKNVERKNVLYMTKAVYTPLVCFFSISECDII